jgi:hypothetical protein
MGDLQTPAKACKMVLPKVRDQAPHGTQSVFAVLGAMARVVVSSFMGEDILPISFEFSGVSSGGRILDSQAGTSSLGV